MSKRKAGEENHTTGGVVAPLVVSSPIAPLAAANHVTYAVITRMRFLDHANLLPDLVSIIQGYCV